MEKQLITNVENWTISGSQQTLEVRIKGSEFKKILQHFGPVELLACEWKSQNDMFYVNYSLFRILFERRQENVIEFQVPIWESAQREKRSPKQLEALAEMEKAARILDQFRIEGAGQFRLRFITYNPDQIEFDANGLPSESSYLTFTYKRRHASPRPAKK